MPATSRRLGLLLVLVQSLHLYGAAAVCALGWAVATLLDFPSGDLWPLWFCGMLAAYNLDRLKPDPADRINVPLRTHTAARFASLSLGFVIASSLFLIIFPAVLRDWMLALLVAVGALCAASYSLPLARRRLKDLPWIKTLAPPFVVAASFLAPAAMRDELPTWPRVCGATTWLLCLLLANMLICDTRDVAGDRLVGVRSIPVALGKNAALRLAATLIILGGVMALMMSLTEPEQGRVWLSLALSVPAYTLPIIVVARIPRSEAFHEWFVEGMFFIPPLVVGLTGAFRPSI